MAEIKEFLATPKKLAIIGASTNPSKAGYYVPEFLKKRGYSFVLINPMTDEINGVKTIADIDNLDETVDGVIIYRRADSASVEAKKAVAKGIPWIWLPLGVTSEEARQAAIDMKYVEDECPKHLIETWIKEGEWKN